MREASSQSCKRAGSALAGRGGTRFSLGQATGLHMAQPECDSEEDASRSVIADAILRYSEYVISVLARTGTPAAFTAGRNRMDWSASRSLRL